MPVRELVSEVSWISSTDVIFDVIEFPANRAARNEIFLELSRSLACAANAQQRTARMGI
jgi:hypothetical protein